MAKYGVILHTTWFGNSVIDKTFSSAPAARKFARQVARDTDITANAAIFNLKTPHLKEWMF